MSISIDLQVASDVDEVPDPAQFRRWVTAAIGARHRRASVSIRITGDEEMRALNQKFRARDAPTNVLSFAADIAAPMRTALLGDLVLCAPVIDREASEQGKPALAHWAHMVVHGTLHLLGHDHEADAEAQRMEALEVTVLRDLGIGDPYRAD